MRGLGGGGFDAFVWQTEYYYSVVLLGMHIAYKGCMSTSMIINGWI